MDYDEISHAFIKANLVGSPAELHGFLAGSASSGKLLSADSLIETVAKFLEVSSERVEDLGTMLIELYQFSVNQINNNDYDGSSSYFLYTTAIKDTACRKELYLPSPSVTISTYLLNKTDT